MAKIASLNKDLQRILRLMGFPGMSITPETLSSSSSSYTVQYLINSCGLPLKTALSVSMKFQLDQTNPQKHESVLVFLRCHGFTDTHIAKVITKCPDILRSRVDGTLKPKMNCLLESGFTGSLLHELVIANPIILLEGLTSRLRPSIDLFKTYLGSHKKVVVAAKRTWWPLNSDAKGRMQPNIDFLISEGVPISNISKLIYCQPKSIMMKVDHMVHAVNTAKQLGLKPNAPMFVQAVRVIVNRSESTWNSNVNYFISILGWSEEDVKSAFQRCPSCFTCSEEKIKNVKDFFVDTMKLEASALLSYPQFFTYSIDKRMRPRYVVLKILESKKLVTEEDMKFTSTFKLREKDFINNYVIKHLDQVPNLMKLYRDTIPIRYSFKLNSKD